ncbi:flavodoxin [Bacillus sp. FJAT-47783]|uniref:flavodoxin n=1 Tax=Bacillus sp. FJAT-47783 TaxID=2922712 RepID=UPI001FACE04A|nr:flavodoxin [Bacillus sp. FJAT-47783]
MEKIILVFASMSGNTEAMADEIVNGIKKAGGEVEVLDMIEATTASILEEYDGILLGAYTWGDGELPDEFLDFYDEMEDLNLKGKKAAVFGSGDTSYPQFCGAVDILTERLKERGAEMVLDGLKVELTPEGEDVEACIQFGERFVQKLKGEKEQPSV